MSRFFSHTDHAASLTRKNIAAGLALGAAFVASFVWDQDYNLQAASICLAGIGLALLLAMPPHATWQQRLTPILVSILITLTGLFTWTWVRAITSDVPATSMMGAGYYTIPMMVALWSMFQNKNDGLKWAGTIIWLTISLIAGVDIIIAAYGDITGDYLQRGSRTDWPMQDANHLAMVMNAGLLANLALALHSNYRRFGLIGAELCLIAITLAGSRAGTIALVIGLILFVWLQRKALLPMRRSVLRVILIGLITVATIAIIRPNGTYLINGFDELVDNIDQSSGNRPMMWKNTFDLSTERPWFGYGVATFLHVYPQTMTPKNYDAGFAAHNDLLQVGLEMGLIGAGLYAGLGLLIVVAAWQSRAKHRKDSDQLIRTACLAIMATLATHAQIEFMLMVAPVLMLFGLALGLFLRGEGAVLHATGSRMTISSYAMALLLIFCLTVSISQTYAQISTERSNDSFNRGDLDGFAKNLERASFYSFDSHAYPYLATATSRLALMMGEQENRPETVQAIQNAVNASRIRNPYSSIVYDMQGRIDELQGRSPEMAWRQGLAIEPRSADLRILLIRYYERNGRHADAAALASESKQWAHLRGRSGELQLLLKKYH